MNIRIWRYPVDMLVDVGHGACRQRSIRPEKHRLAAPRISELGTVSRIAEIDKLFRREPEFGKMAINTRTAIGTITAGITTDFPGSVFTREIIRIGIVNIKRRS